MGKYIKFTEKQLAITYNFSLAYRSFTFPLKIIIVTQNSIDESRRKYEMIFANNSPIYKYISFLTQSIIMTTLNSTVHIGKL